ncbi:CBS domain-containing protein [Amycolatopsis minnesotensis]|uniref:CBS domain-containing protein n=1 Tax=Amycolatopsis minnesotensis TaxID=337894 RepID=A0ABN2R8R0_9PSEU
MQAHDVMTSPVRTVTPETTVKDAASLLASHGFTALPVLDDTERLIGIVTEADLIRGRFPRDPRYHHGDAAMPAAAPATVGEVMTTPAIGMGAGADVVDLASVMLTDGVRSLPIVDGSTVIGIVTRRDLLRTLARDDRTISADIRHQLAMYGAAGRWSVRVDDGVVAIGDEFDNETDRHVATVLAEAVPGVTAVHVVSETTGNDHLPG